MAQINLKIKSDFAQASKDLKTFGTITESQKKKVQAYQQSFNNEKVDSFIDANRRLGAGMQANKGTISAIITQQKALERQSINLIKNGLDPESEEVEKLNDEYNRLQGEYDKTKKASEGMESASKAAKTALVGIGVAVGAAVGTFLKLASSVEMVEAGFTPLLGSTEKAKELVSELNETAATTPFQFEAISKAAKQLLPVMNQDIEQTVDTFRMLGDTAGGNAQKLESITKGYTKAMLKNKVDMESLNMIAEAGVPIYTELADSLGVTVAEMTKMSSTGKITSADLTETFQKMTKEGGIFFNGMEIASQTAEGKLSTISDVFKNIGVNIGNNLLPSFKSFLDTVIKSGSNILSFTKDSEKMDKVLKIVGLSLAGATAGLVTFLALSKGAAVIQALSGAFVALNLAMKANPAVFIASAIVAVLIPAVILLVKNWDTVSEVIQTSLVVIGKNFKMLGVNMKTSWIVAINSLKIAFLSLGTIIVDNVLGAVQKLLDIASHIPFIGDKFKDLSDSVGETREAFNSLTTEAKENSLQIINGAKNERDEIKKTSDENIQNIKGESKKRLEALKTIEDENEKTSDSLIANAEEVAAVNADLNEKKLENEKDSNIISIDQYRDMLDEKAILSQKAFDDLKSNTNTAITQIDSIADSAEGEALSTISGLVSAIGEASGIVELQAVALGLTLIESMTGLIKEKGAEGLGEVLGEALKAAVEGLADIMKSALLIFFPVFWEDFGNGFLGAFSEEAEEVVDVMVSDLEKAMKAVDMQSFELDSDNLYYDRRISQINSEYDLKKARTLELEAVRLKEYEKTLSLEEKMALREAGIIEETNMERIQRELKAAKESNDENAQFELKNEYAIEKIKLEIAERQRKEELTNARQLSIIERRRSESELELAKAKAAIEKATALAELDSSSEEYKNMKYLYDVYEVQLGKTILPEVAVATSDNTYNIRGGNSFTGQSQTLAEYDPEYWNEVVMASNKSSIPFFATGTPMGNFTVPNNPSSSRADNTNIAVSPGEQVSVTPRGESNNQSQNIVIQIGKETILDIINEGVENGDIRITTDNIQGGVSVA